MNEDLKVGTVIVYHKKNDQENFTDDIGLILDIDSHGYEVCADDSLDYVEKNEVKSIVGINEDTIRIAAEINANLYKDGE